MYIRSLVKMIYREKVGRPPGEWQPDAEGDQHSPSKVVAYEYTETELQKIDLKTARAVRELEIHPQKVYWIRVRGLGSRNIMTALKNRFSIHSLHMEDIYSVAQRPKAEEHNQDLFAVLKEPVAPKGAKDTKEGLTFRTISFYRSENVVISFARKSTGLFDPIDSRLVSSQGRIRKRGAGYLLMCLLDVVVDRIQLWLFSLEEDILKLEEDATAADDLTGIEHRMLRVRQSLFLGWRYLRPLKDVVGILRSSGRELIDSADRPYYNDLYDHTQSVVDYLETGRTLLESAAEAYQTRMSQKLNQTMKFLAVVSTTFIPLSFIAGLYGMNFKFMPELNWAYGYPVVLGIMFATAGGMLYWFHRKRL